MNKEILGEIEIRIKWMWQREPADTWEPIFGTLEKRKKLHQGIAH